MDEFQQAKRAKLLDLLRRATANGTHQQVVDAIMPDWCPAFKVDAKGKITIRMSDSSLSNTTEKP